MRNQYGVTVAIIATVLGSSNPAFADSTRDALSQVKNSPRWQTDAIKKMPPDIVIDNTSSIKQNTLERLPFQQQNIWSGNSFRAGMHK